MRYKILLILLFFVCKTSLSQNISQTVRGTVLDKDSKAPLWGASVVVVNSSPLIGIQTDSSGSFKLKNVPVGRHTFKVTFIGYDDVILPEILVSTGKEIVLSIEMQEKITSMRSVTIKADKNKDNPLNSMATVSARSFNVEETGRYAACLNDPARMAQSFAGVSLNGDESNEIIIRGNSPSGLLWRMEGIEIPNPNHFSNGNGDSGGGVSMLSNTMLSNSDFFTGAFPAEYGNALSGVFDINLRKGNNEEHEYALQLGVLGMEAAAEGPFSGKYNGSYLISYRYSTLDFLYKIGVKPAGNIVPKYQDVQFNFYFPTKKMGKFNLWGIGGTDNTSNTPIKDSTKWQTYEDILNYNNLQRTGVIGLSHLLMFKDNRTYLKTVAAVSDDRNVSIEDTLNKCYNLRPIYRDTFDYIVSRISVSLNHKFDSKNVLITGLIYGNYHYSLTSKELNPQTGDFNFLMNAKGNTGLAEYFIQWQHRPTEDLTINTGIHAMYFMLNNHYSVEPRFGLKWQFNNDMAMNAGIGLHSRIESVYNYMTEDVLPNGSIVRPNIDLNFTRAFHAVAGYDYTISEDLRFKAELYYQYLFDVPVQDTSSSFSTLNCIGGENTDITMINKGKGYNYGLDMTLEKFFTKSYYLMFTASLYESKYRGSDGVMRKTLFDGNYSFNALAGKEFKTGKDKNNIFNINTRIIWKGGNRLTPIDMEKSINENQTVFIEDEAFQLKGPDYFRIDLQISYRKNRPKCSWIVSLDFENVTNRLNVYDEYFDTKTKQIEKNYNLGILPILNFKIEF
ncbi:MAG: TonB-dependent receptor [Bacteroidales bacterium]